MHKKETSLQTSRLVLCITSMTYYAAWTTNMHAVLYTCAILLPQIQIMDSEWYIYNLLCMCMCMHMTGGEEYCLPHLDCIQQHT